MADLLRGGASGIILKDALDDCRFLWNDFELSSDQFALGVELLHWPVSVCLAACGQALFYQATHASSDLEHIPFAEHLGLKAVQRDADEVRLTFVHGDKADVQKTKLPVHERHVGNVA
ncbi:hypothetical protein K8M09_13290 [Shinella zoogloeoides]|nr:hypothetical protein [Shinella zoogloeoides]UEX80575.1 hypothetical protein K8M09_13290 [Shinella zoogloeoides]